MLHRTIRVEHLTDLNAAIVVLEAAGAIGSAHLCRALRDGRCALMWLLPEVSASHYKRFIRAAGRRPAIIVLGDDDGLNRGPQAFPLAQRAIGWARCVFLHAAGAKLEHYEMAILIAQGLRRLLFIECSSVTELAWLDLTKRHASRHLRLIQHFVSANGPHPKPTAREQLQ